jgi:hypothetical protein
MTTEDQKIFFPRLLELIGVPNTRNNRNFMYAWSSAESSKAKNNPLATTWKTEYSSYFNCLKKDASGNCILGVQNYKTMEIGLSATAKTLKQDFYKAIIKHLKKDTDTVYRGNLAMKAAFDKWGTTYKLFLTRYENGKYGKVKSGTGGSTLPWLLAAAAAITVTAATSGKRKRQGFR